jgi:hypothetical protein
MEDTHRPVRKATGDGDHEMCILKDPNIQLKYLRVYLYVVR